MTKPHPDEMDLLPGFLILGAMKSGTTGLYDDLATHPGVWMPRIKEPDVLHKARSSQDVRDLYRKHFAGAQPAMLLGEGSTKYTMVPWFPDVSRIARDVLAPNTRLIYIMRDPLARIVSHLAHDFSVGRISTTDFDRLVWEECRYLSLSDYAFQLAPWIEAFGTQNLLCLAFEDYIDNRERVVRQVAIFLGLDAELLQARALISNPRGSIRESRLALVNRIAATGFYRYGVARVLPRVILDGFKVLLTRRRELPMVGLSDECSARVRAHFSGLGGQLESLGVGRFEW